MDFQLLFEESPDVLLVLLPDSPRFTAVAATKSRLASTHSTAEQTLGRGLFELFPDNPDDPSATGMSNLRASLERVLATRATDTMAVQKYDIPRPEGGFEVKYWSPCNIPILSAGGEIRYILHRAVDVTDLARASEQGEELRGRSEEMRREVVRRSAELDAANRQLREANERLSQLDASKTAFFSNISHEFRTPLTLMLGPLEELLAGPDSLPARDRRSVQLVHDNAMRLLKLVNALLDFSRLQAGRLLGSFSLNDYSALSRDLAGMFQTAFDKAGIRLVLDCPPLSESIWLDPDLWEKVVPNLVSNAFKFTLTGQVAVRTSETATSAILEVIDTGTGIESKELPHLFERFYRVDGAVGRTHEGAGIGLSLVRELVELHGGRVSAQSRAGIGSVFRVEIPKGSGHLPPANLVREAPSARARSNPHATEAARWQSTPVSSPVLDGAARGARVLVVDDNADLRDYMCGLLAPHYRLLTACDGAEALESIRNDAPDIVVSDVMMPRMNGIELVQAIRSDPTLVSIPVILLSARAGGEATVEGLDAGADDYLTKPFTAQELLARVKAHVQLSHTRRRCTSELEQANRDLDAFSYSVAHDLRGPLRLIDGFSLMLLEENAQQLDGEGRRRLDVVRGSAKRMSQLIDDLLYLAHLNRNEVRRMPFELSMLVRTVASQWEQDAKGRHVSMEIEPQVMVDGDPQLLRIVLENLLGNAWKFTSKRNDARIEFGTVARGGEVCYFVRDNGAGFDMAYAAKLFNVFQRLHSDADFQGSGIGLATVKRIIGRHGGRVWAEGEVGVGATFYFTLGDVQDADLHSSALRQSDARA